MKTATEYVFGWPCHLTESDRRGLLDLYSEVAEDEGTLGFYGSLRNSEGERLVESYANALGAGHIHVLVVRDEQGVVGTLTLEQPMLHARRHIVDLKRCVIAKRSRGKFLYEGWLEARRKAYGIGGRILTMEVRDDGPVELWKSIGFQEYGLLPDYARRDGQPILGHYLCYALTEERIQQS